MYFVDSSQKRREAIFNLVFCAKTKGQNMIEIHDYIAVLVDIKETPVKRGTTETVVSKLSDTH